MIFYTIWYNSSLKDSGAFSSLNEPEPKDPELMFLQQSIDNSILAYLHEQRVLSSSSMLKDSLPPKINSSYSDYPSPLDRIY